MIVFSAQIPQCYRPTRDPTERKLNFRQDIPENRISMLIIPLQTVLLRHTVV
jgi:hypothetical protein